MPTAGAAQAWDRVEIEAAPWPQVTCPTAEPVKAKEDLKAEIEKAKKVLLALPSDWDGEGSKGYSQETFERAVTFLNTHADYIRQFDLVLPTPTIGPGPDGSIDLFWKRASWELLVNIPADPARMATFYGDNYGVQRIKGSVDPATCNVGLAAWLMT